MANGYKILWTEHALTQLEETVTYLQTNFSEKELRKLAKELDHLLQLISKNPSLFPLSDSVNIRRVVVRKFNTLYYSVQGDSVVILSFFSNRQSPEKKGV
jgi:plasmid stabilization system protein ParE